MVLVPLLSAAGFLRMDRAVSIASATPASGALTLGARASLEPWREAIMASYIALVVGAFLAGRASSR
jgi:hypothetical protein